MRRSMLYKLTPYFIVVIWMIGVTVYVASNTQKVNNNATTINLSTIARTKAICLATNKIDGSINTMILKLKDQSDPPDKEAWSNLYIELKDSLAQINCDHITIDGVPTHTTSTTFKPG